METEKEKVKEASNRLTITIILLMLSFTSTISVFINWLVNQEKYQTTLFVCLGINFILLLFFIIFKMAEDKLPNKEHYL